MVASAPGLVALESVDGEAWEKYLGVLRVGGGRRAAARTVGVPPRTVSAWLREHPDREAEVVEVESEAVELVETALFERALAGDVRAAGTWLDRRAPSVPAGGGSPGGAVVLSQEDLKALVARAGRVVDLPASAVS